MSARTTLRLFVLSSAVVAGASLPAVHGLRAEPSSTVAATTLPVQDPHRRLNARIDDLRHRLTLAEKIALLHQFQPAIGWTSHWLRFGDADLGRRTRSFSAEVASVAAGGTIEVRLDRPGGRLLGTAQVPATGDVYTYATVTAPLAAASGRHDVYLVGHGSFRISTFAVD